NVDNLVRAPFPDDVFFCGRHGVKNAVRVASPQV
ncbi:MAG: hypothetical protein ACI9NQ_001389, partial [Paracoccaceae bacterium]